MKIGIFGDSLGCGVWGLFKGNDWTDKTDYVIVHLGIQHYLWKNNHTVVNFSKPGIENGGSL